MIDPNVVDAKYRKYAKEHDCHAKCMLIDRPFPFELFKVYDDWLPDPVRLLLLAESPPFSDYPENYFYNTDYCGNLRSEVFSLFGIHATKEEDKLSDFMGDERGYLLIDTVMCAFNTAVKNIPIGLAEYSGREIIKQEIEHLRPPCILALGRRALCGLKSFEPFSTGLGDVDSVYMTDEGRAILRQCESSKVVVCPFPNTPNLKNYRSQIEDAFAKAARIAKESVLR